MVSEALPVEELDLRESDRPPVEDHHGAQAVGLVARAVRRRSVCAELVRSAPSTKPSFVIACE
jgi:hypothetical protein